MKTENAHLNAQMAAMAQELSQKSEEIWKYHAEQAVVFRRIRELVGQPGEIVNKARLYDQLVGSGDPVTARQTIPILVKYSRMMNNLFEDIQKVVPPSGTPRRVLYQGPPGSPTGTLYEAVREVAIVHNPPTVVEQGDGSRPGSSGKAPEMTRSSQVRRKSTGSDRTRRGQSHVCRTSDRSRTPDRARTPIRRRTPERETTSGKGKSRAHQASPCSPPDCLMLESTHTPPSRVASIRDPVTVLGERHPEPHTGNNPTETPTSRWSPVSRTPGTRTPRAQETRDSEDDIAPSPNMRRALTRLQKKASPGTSSLIGGLDISWKERATPKKPLPS